MSCFARVTALNGKVHWMNTAIYIDSHWVERQIIVSERPEDIAGQV